MIAAIIDLGTNTCNLLIAETNGSDHKILHQSKQMVQLGDSKIKTNEISDDAIHRVIESFQAHKIIIQKFDVDSIKVIATSAIRSALNKNEFLNTIFTNTGLEIEVVSGEREAELIFNGVLLAFGKLAQPSIILDIGGGSNELIVADKIKMLWKESRPTGMGRVINNFVISDPIKEEEEETLRNYFAHEHKNSFRIGNDNNIQTLIGCSGAFDTIADLIDKVDPGDKQRIKQEIEIDDFYKVYKKLIKSTRTERIKMRGMDMVRVDLIVPAVILIEKLISAIDINKIIQTDYALREGVLYEIINE